MASAVNPKPSCPVCRQADQVKKLQTAYESGIQRFAPPTMPVKRVGMMRNISIGVVVVGICIFLILVLIGSGSFGQDFSVPELILVGVSLIAIVTALVVSFLTFQRVVRGDLESQKDFPAWDRALENWNRLYFCARDNVVFDPQTNKTVSDAALADLLSEGQQAQGKSASAAH